MVGASRPGHSRRHSISGVDRDAPDRFLGTIFESTDSAAIFLKLYERAGVVQRVGPVSWIRSERVQRWLRAMNARKYNVFVRLLNKQVGGELGISEITVKAHRGQVMRKMKADSLPDLVTMAARLGVRSAPAH